MTRGLMALRGLAAATAIVVVAVVSIMFSAGSFDRSPTVTSSVAVLGSPIRLESAVQYRGVRVGTLQSVDADPDGRSTLVLRMDREAMARVPADVRVRILPLTLFGDQVIDLAPPGGATVLGISAGATLAADDSTETVALYTAYQKLYDTLNELQPAKINMVLAAVADTLRGRGSEIGRSIHTLHRLTGELDPLIESLGPTLDTVARVSDKLSQSAPDLFAALRNATQISQFLEAKQQDIAAMLSGGIGLSDEAGAFFERNHDDIITVLRTADPVVAVLARNPDGLPNVLDAVARTGRATSGLSNQSNLDALLSVEDTRTYGPRDCPRYGPMNGPNCGSAAAPEVLSPWSTRPAPGGTVGAVGSPEETGQLQQLLPQLPGATSTTTEPDAAADGLRGLLLGPVLRGSTVQTR